MPYYIDLSKISLEEYKSILLTTVLLPSRQILKENVDERFHVLKNHNIENLRQLQLQLKTPAKVKQFAETSLLPMDYLTVLRREINSYHPDDRKLKDFTCIKTNTLQALEAMGIKTTAGLYDYIVTKAARQQLQQQLGISDSEIMLLTKLTDLSRLRYVNSTFAMLLIASGYGSVEKIKQADYQELYERVKKTNEKEHYFKGTIGLSDMKFLVDDPMSVPFDIEY
ncbi:DUF4332 domain-containing protein [candidate division KSB1 bacterium]|nr:DUF4332 domain-containing protein [candidate division KSB1 bacterium]